MKIVDELLNELEELKAMEDRIHNGVRHIGLALEKLRNRPMGEIWALEIETHLNDAVRCLTTE